MTESLYVCMVRFWNCAYTQSFYFAHNQLLREMEQILCLKLIWWIIRFKHLIEPFDDNLKIYLQIKTCDKKIKYAAGFLKLYSTITIRKSHKFYSIAKITSSRWKEGLKSFRSIQWHMPLNSSLLSRVTNNDCI